MNKTIKNFSITLLFFILTILLLTFPKESLSFSFTGLQLWFNRMLPTLLPFMILSAVMIKLNLTENFVCLLNPILNPFLSISPDGIYAVIIGFLCGFPMGAKITADLYTEHKLSRNEASFLLCFCNNIGPVYFLSFVLPTLGLSKKLPYLFGMYGLPLLYGIFLRHTLYKNKIPKKSPFHPICPTSISLADALDESIMSSLLSIAKLGGYMILFNLLNLFPAALTKLLSFPTLFHLSITFCGINGLTPDMLLNCLLEITSGISRMGNLFPLPVLLLLPFGGFSCLAQTCSMLKGTDLSIKNYVFHKMILTIITIIYYGLWLLFSPSSFLL